MVQFIPLRQNFPSRLWKQYIINCLHPMLHTTRLCARSACVYTVHSGSCTVHVVEHGVSFHEFANDMQLYVHYRRDDMTFVILRLENCIEEVSHWMSANRKFINSRFCASAVKLLLKMAVNATKCSIFTARCYASAVLAMGLCLSVCPCPSVSHKSEFY